MYLCSTRWLIEVNASPSLTASSKEDYDLKIGLLEDVVNIIDLENRLILKLHMLCAIVKCDWLGSRL